MPVRLGPVAPYQFMVDGGRNERDDANAGRARLSDAGGMGTAYGDVAIMAAAGRN